MEKKTEIKNALQVLSGEVQQSFAELTLLVDSLETARAVPDKLLPLQMKLKDELAHLSEGLSLVGTILETESNEILHYVKKRAR
jgi:hypothetical protein